MPKIVPPDVDFRQIAKRIQSVIDVIQVHDSVGFQLPLSIPWTEHAKMLWSIKESLETPLTAQEREFTVPTDLALGVTLNKNDGEEIKAKDFPTSVEKLADKLKENWDKLCRSGD